MFIPLSLNFSFIIIDCVADCAECNSDTSCAECEAGSFWSNQTLICEKCSEGCSNCSGSATSCQTCPMNTYLNPDNTCSITCPNGYYESGGICVECDTTCATCNGTTAKDCITCEESRFFDLSTSSCLASCATGTFYDIDAESCADCSGECSKCSGSPSNCSSCPDNKFLLTSTTNNASSCVDSCGNGFFEDNQARVCQSE